ncbi:MAG: NERD domain-containing protein [Eubacterium sp.]|nr:NERD domain-containing protein [Eubacterium sp.]
MPDIYKHGYENFKIMSVLFVAQILLGVLPAVLLAIFICADLYSTPLIGYIFIAIMVAGAVANIMISKRYNVLLSGFRGEKSLMRAIKKLKNEDYTVFSNLPIKYKKNRSEIDFLLVCPDYILIIEVKNHSGKIYGKHKDDQWLQKKVYRDGKTTETYMQNPLKQLRRQRDILKCILSANGLDRWVDTMLYFSSPQVKLYLDLFDNDNVCSSEKELLEFLSTYKSKSPATKEELEKINNLFKEMHNA